MAGVRLDGDQAGLQKPFVIHDRVPRGHHRVDGTVPREHRHLHRDVEHLPDGVGVHALVLQVAVTVAAFHGSLQEGVDLVLVAQRERGVLAALPVLVEAGLQAAAHELLHRLLGITLHAGVDGGIDLQAVAVDVIRLAVGTIMGVGPFGEFLAELLAEIGGLTAVVVHHPEMRHVDGDLRHGVVDGLGDIVVLHHALQHQVAALHGAFGVAHRAESGRGVHHAGHQGTLLEVQVLWVLVEEGLGRRTDAIGVVPEGHRVEVHGDDLVFRVVVFELGGGDPFLELAKHQLGLAQVLAAGKQVLGQLLGDSTAAAFLVAREHAVGHAEQRLAVDARVLVETLVLDAYQSLG